MPFFSTHSLKRHFRGAIGLLLLAGLPLGHATAQVVGQYVFTQATAPWVPLTGGQTFQCNTQGTGTDDNYSAPQALPFAFQLGTRSVTSFSVSTNGFLTFDAGSATPYNTPLNGPKNNLIAFLGMDLLADSATFRNKTSGTAPNRVYKIEAKRIKEFGTAGCSGSVQVWLFEGSNAVELHYGPFPGPWSNGTVGGAQVGLRGADTTQVLAVTGSWAAPVASTSSRVFLPLNDSTANVPTSGLVFRFALPLGVDFGAPSITSLTLTPSSSQCSAVVHTVQAAVTDSSGLTTIELVYQAGAVLDTIPMHQIPGSTLYAATIPATPETVTWRVRAVDASPTANVALSAPQTYTDAPLRISAGPDQVANVGSPVTLTASMSAGASVRITEFTLYSQGAGATVLLPAYVLTSAADFVELTNLGTGAADLSQYVFEVQASGAAAHTWTFPAGTTLAGRATLLLHLGSGQDSAAVNYFNTGGSDDALSSGTDAAFVLRTPGGQVIDAVVVNNYQPAAPLMATDWAGAGVGSPSGVAGAGLYGADANDSTSWRQSSLRPQSLGSLNAALPIIGLPTTITWRGGLLTAPVTSATVTTPAHTVTGTYVYLVTATDSVCTVTDSVTVHIIQPGSLAVNFAASATAVDIQDVVSFTDRTVGFPTSWQWRFVPAAGVVFENGTTATSQNPIVRFVLPGAYAVTLTVSNGTVTDSLTRTSYVGVALRYCVANLQTSPCLLGNGFIDGVRIVGTTLDNPATGCPTGTTAPGYTAYPATGPTTATLAAGQTYTLAVTSSTIGSVAAWLDYNNDGLFDTAEYISVASTGTPNQPVNVAFTVPATARAAPQTGLRIRNGAIAGSIAATNACSTRVTGETEDYLVTISRPLGLVPASGHVELTVWPNPTTGLVRVALPGGVTELVACDALGRQVRAQAPHEASVLDFDLRELPAGIYFLRARLADGSTALRRVELTK